MTRTTNARVAGFTYLFYIAVAFPGMVLGSLDTAPKIDPTKIQIEVPQAAPDETPPIQFK